MQTSCDIIINAPLEKVFEVFSDITQIQNNLNGVTNIEILSDVSSGVGTKWRETRIMFGKEATEEMWITEFDAPNSYKVAAESHGTKYLSTYTFEEQEDSSVKVTMTFSGQPVSLSAKIFSVIGFLFIGSVKKALAQDMEDLKKVCESK